MTHPPITPVLLCGGSGTRLWPLSRKSYPKQFAALTGRESLFQLSARRLCGAGFAAPLIVSGEEFRFIVTDQMAAAGLTPAAILIEPEGRNTAPAVLAAALWAEAANPGALLLAAPSDHVIPDDAGFRASVRAAVPAAMAGQLVTFGIRPTRAETGYGWLEPESGSGLRAVRRFAEKPDLPQASAMLAGGRHLWNAGIFLFRAVDLVQAFAAHAPDLLPGVGAALDGAKGDLSFTRLDPEAWRGLRDVSLDFAVMEKARNLMVMPYEGEWSDLGDWEAVRRAAPQDAQGVALSGAASAIDCTDTLLRSEAGGLALVGIGLTDIVAIAMPDAVLIAHKDRAQDVKLAVAALKSAGRPQAETFPRDHRPWGWFESIALGPRFQVKRIHVHPGASLSLQSHLHRAEHWIVVEGTARVTIGDQVSLVSENQSVFIPLGARHRLENPGKLAMVLIEVQTGAYLGEDDIQRHDDRYARS